MSIEHASASSAERREDPRPRRRRSPLSILSRCSRTPRRRRRVNCKLPKPKTTELVVSLITFHFGSRMIDRVDRDRKTYDGPSICASDASATACQPARVPHRTGRRHTHTRLAQAHAHAPLHPIRSSRWHKDTRPPENSRADPRSNDRYVIMHGQASRILARDLHGLPSSRNSSRSLHRSRNTARLL
jgi:hypothetical protein